MPRPLGGGGGDAALDTFETKSKEKYDTEILNRVYRHIKKEITALVQMAGSKSHHTQSSQQ